MYHFNHSQVNNLVALIFTMLGNHHYYLPAEHVRLSCPTKILSLMPKLCSHPTHTAPWPFTCMSFYFWPILFNVVFSRNIHVVSIKFSFSKSLKITCIVPLLIGSQTSSAS